MRRPLRSIRVWGPIFKQVERIGRSGPDPDPEGSLVVAKVDVVGEGTQTRGTLTDEFRDNMINVVADAVAEATQRVSGGQGATPINFDEAVMFQVFPVSVGQDFQKGVIVMMYDQNLIGEEPDIEENIRVRTDRVERFDVIPV